MREGDKLINLSTLSILSTFDETKDLAPAQSLALIILSILLGKRHQSQSAPSVIDYNGRRR